MLCRESLQVSTSRSNRVITVAQKGKLSGPVYIRTYVDEHSGYDRCRRPVAWAVPWFHMAVSVDTMVGKTLVGRYSISSASSREGSLISKLMEEILHRSWPRTREYLVLITLKVLSVLPSARYGIDGSKSFWKKLIALTQNQYMILQNFKSEFNLQWRNTKDKYC